MTIYELRKKFWWLGPDGCFINDFDGTTATLRVPQTTWNPPVLYQLSLARQFANLGIEVTWEETFDEVLLRMIADRTDRLLKKGVAMNRKRFIARMKKWESISLQSTASGPLFLRLIKLGSKGKGQPSKKQGK